MRLEAERSKEGYIYYGYFSYENTYGGGWVSYVRFQSARIASVKFTDEFVLDRAWA